MPFWFAKGEEAEPRSNGALHPFALGAARRGKVGRVLAIRREEIVPPAYQVPRALRHDGLLTTLRMLFDPDRTAARDPLLCREPDHVVEPVVHEQGSPIGPEPGADAVVLLQR